MNTKKFTLSEISELARTLSYILSFKMDPIVKYKIYSFADPFFKRNKIVETGKNDIIRSYLGPKEFAIPEDKIPQYQRELTDYLNSEDDQPITFGDFKLEWLGKREYEDITNIFQFVKEEQPQPDALKKASKNK